MNEQNQTNLPPPKFHLLPLRTFMVRKYYTADNELTTLTIHAHLVNPLAGGMVVFVDFEQGETEPIMHIHRIIYNVEDVEEVLRTAPSRSLITH